MNHWDRLQAALRGDAVDCRPIALWRHWPDCDRDPHLLARAVMAWQRRFDFDLLVFASPDTWVAECFGARAACGDEVLGRRTVTRHPVTQPDHWLRLRPAAAGVQPSIDWNAGLKRVADALGGTAPLLQSVPSPLTTAWQLAGDGLFEHIRAAPESVQAGLRTIADATAFLVHEALAAGASGARLRVHLPERDRIGGAGWARFGRPFDMQVIQAVGDGIRWNLLELDAAPAWFDDVLDYPVELLAWQDRTLGPPLPVGAARFSGLVAGGFDASGTLGQGTRSAVDAEVVRTLAGLESARALLSTGGPCRLDTPVANIDGLIDAVRRRIDVVKEEKRR